MTLHRTTIALFAAAVTLGLAAGWWMAGDPFAAPKTPQRVAVPTCDDGHADACLAEALRHLARRPPAIEEALSLGARGCRGGSQGACFWLGQTYTQGTWVDADPEQAATFMGGACELGGVDSCELWLKTLAKLPDDRREARVTARLAAWEAACRPEDPEEERRGCHLLVWWQDSAAFDDDPLPDLCARLPHACQVR